MGGGKAMTGGTCRSVPWHNTRSWRV